MANYARLANLTDEEEKPKSSYRKLASMEDDAEVSEPVKPSDSLGLGRGTGLTGRAIIQGMAGLPLMAMDIGVGARNVGSDIASKIPGAVSAVNKIRTAIGLSPVESGEQYELPSSLFDKALTASGLPEPKGAIEKGGSLAVSIATGSKLPSPQIENRAPDNFIRPSDNPMQETLKAAQQAGYVVPPATTNPSALNKTAESLAGKISTAQAAAVKNQEITNELARKAVGLASDEQITPASLRDLRSVAGKVYQQIADSGDITPDQQYLEDLIKLGKGADEISRAFPEANVGATKQIGQMVDSLLQDKFSSKAALAYLKELRSQAKGNLSPMVASDPAKRALGMAQREAASTLEELIERHLTAGGEPELAQSFQQARKIIAVTHTVESALNESTGNVVATKLGQQLAKGKPLSGELEIVAKFARAFPKAAKETTESMPGASPLDWYGAGGITAISGNPLAMLLPHARAAIRGALLSRVGQKMSVSGPKGIDPSKLSLGLAPSALIQAAPIIQEQLP